MPKISVAMTTYNGETYIVKQLRSLVSQSLPADEVIICDDCSCDETAALVEAFIKEHSLRNWHFTVNERNLGFKRNFHQAIAATTGEILFLCDQDDIWDEHKIEWMTAKMGENSWIKALNCSYAFIDEEDLPLPVSEKSAQHGLPFAVAAGNVAKIPFRLIAGKNYFPGCTLAITEELKEVYLREWREDVLHDWYLNFLASFCFDGLYFYQEPLIRYRMHRRNTIGMEVVFHKTMSSRGSLETRLAESINDERVVRDFLKTAQQFAASRQEEIAFLKAYLDFLTTKRQALEKGSLRQILALFRHREIYRQHQSLQSRMMDVYAVIKKG